jgi:hypothetical protein
LSRIVTLANSKVRLRFLAMERSLRAVGCDLPLLVIPYDDARFDLPKNAEWWEVPEVINWTIANKMHPMMRKYQCLLIENFQFVDSDVCFLRNPRAVLAPFTGFITSCGHWNNPNHTVTSESEEWLKKQSTIWQSSIFNAGQWACSESLYDFPSLKKQAEEPDFKATCVDCRFNDQSGVNQLVNATGVRVTNLTMPPHNMQSTWAGDYDGDYRRYWRNDDETPYLIHWAGVPMYVPRTIHEIFYNYLTTVERSEWDREVTANLQRHLAKNRTVRGRLRRLKRAALAAGKAWRES